MKTTKLFLVMLFSIAVTACGGGGGGGSSTPSCASVPGVALLNIGSTAGGGYHAQIGGGTIYFNNTNLNFSAIYPTTYITDVGTGCLADITTWPTTGQSTVAVVTGHNYVINAGTGAYYKFSTDSYDQGTVHISWVRMFGATATTTAQSLGVGVAMSFSPLTPSGGATPYTYSYTGTLPAGLSFNTSTGAVTGTPTATYATASLVFSVKDANNVVASTTSTVNFTVSLFIPSATATTTPQSLSVGTAMTSFSPLTPSGGATPYTYSYTGTLPAGLSFNTNTGAVTGTPTATYATASLVFSVKDANNMVASTTSTVSFTVFALPGYVAQGGLTWMPVTFSDNWANANAYCTTTTINGQTGWRMPTQPELSALYTSGAMNGQGWTLAFTWSSTVYSVGNHYGVYLINNNGNVIGALDSDIHYVSCVR